MSLTKLNGIRNAKLVTEKPLGPKFKPITNTTDGIEPTYKRPQVYYGA